MNLLGTTLFRRIARSSRYTVAVSAVALSLALTAGPVLAKSRISSNFYEVTKSIDLLGDVYKEVAQHYVDPVDVSELMYTGIDGMLGQLDPYTAFLDEKQAGELEEVTSGQYAGIGITIATISGDLFVTSVIEGQAADRAGLQVGDRIEAVNGLRVADRPLSEVRASIKGTAGTPVTLTVRKDGQGAKKEYVITRGEVRVSTVPCSGLFGSAGYVRLSSFGKHSRAELLSAIRALQQQAASSARDMNGLVLDLRGNPGGLLDSAVDVAALFVEKGSRVVSTKGRASGSQIYYVTRDEPPVASLPLVLLIDAESASASEIVAGAIQELDRGVIVGESSFGKGLVQAVITLPYDHALKLTTAKYYTPSGRLIQKPFVHGMNHLPAHKRKVLPMPVGYDSTKVYYTRNRRKVYGGGGISPDVPVKAEAPLEYQTALEKEGLIFRYAMRFHRKHPDADVQKLSEMPVLKEFRDFVHDERFVFRSPLRQNLDSLKTMIRDEGGEEDKELAGKLAAFDRALADWTEKSIQRDSLRITIAVQREIIRHYNQRAALRNAVEHDPVVTRAFALLGDPASYQRLLKP